MLLTIYDKAGTKRADVAVNDSSTQSKEVQGDNVLSLSFSYYAFLPLDVNDYTDYLGERYWLTERYTPKQVSDGEWEYNLKLYGIESLIKRFLVLETTDGDTNPLFTLTATPREHVAMVVKAINNGMGHITDWKTGTVEGTELITIDYEGMYCDEALKAIAEKAGGKVEWWVEGQTVNVCRCEHGEEITLGYGKGLTSLERDTSNTAKFYTRLFPVGSTRNIDAEKYGSPRLMLPGGRKYIEQGVEEYGIYDHYEQDAFSGIFPRRVGTVSSVRSEEVADDEGNKFTVYYFRDGELDFDPNLYELAGETKRVSFQTGDLAGLGESDDHYFEVNYDSAAREFELITIWPYDDDTQLPGGKLVPRAGDTYILWNIRMPDEYYRLAEEEFAVAVDEYNRDHWLDIAAYKAPTDPVYIEEHGIDLFVGRRVKLESQKYFPEKGYRQSRITKISRKVNEPGQNGQKVGRVEYPGDEGERQAKQHEKGRHKHSEHVDLAVDSQVHGAAVVHHYRKAGKEVGIHGRKNNAGVAHGEGVAGGIQADFGYATGRIHKGGTYEHFGARGHHAGQDIGGAQLDERQTEAQIAGAETAQAVGEKADRGAQIEGEEQGGGDEQHGNNAAQAEQHIARHAHH